MIISVYITPYMDQNTAGVVHFRGMDMVLPDILLILLYIAYYNTYSFHLHVLFVPRPVILSEKF